MNLEICYAQMSLLRELVRAKQVELWETRWLPALKGRTTMTPVEMREAFDRKMNAEVPDWISLSSNEECCSVLMRDFARLEEELQVNLGVKEVGKEAPEQ